MSFWKVLGGVAAGVGAVVALPVAGPIGAVTAVGAIVGGGIGGLVGAAVSAADEEEVEVVRRETERVYKAEESVKVAKLVAALGEAEKRLKDDQDYFNLLIALFSVGIAVANCDGDIAPEEMKDIEEFIAGLGCAHLPPHVKGMITRLKSNPPNFNTAMTHVEKVHKDSRKLFSQVIEIASRADGTIREEEVAFMNAWQQYLAA
jgi:tellurite resistance protein